MRFTITGSAHFLQVLITNVAADGEVAAVKVKGSTTGWIPMGRNWGQNWQCDADPVVRGHRREGQDGHRLRRSAGGLDVRADV